MPNQITGKLIQIMPVQTGTSKNGVWKKQDIILELGGTYPRKVCVAIWGDKVDESMLALGNELTVSFDVESREYNGKWYTDIKAWKVDLGSAALPGSGGGIQAQNPVNEAASPFTSADEDDLPF